ncbi:hypothetical protein JG687_00017971, partial [Phytophthora cactorum]
SEYYVAVFACYEVNGSLKTPLLSMALLLNEANNDLYAESHLDFLVTILPRDFGVSLVGCASHRLNLAVQDDLAVHEDDLAAVQVLFRAAEVVEEVATEVEEPVAAVVVEEADRDDKAVAPAEIVEEKAIEEPVAAKDSVSAEEPAAADEEPYMYLSSE